MRSAVILAGGSGTRLRTEKSLIEFSGRMLIQWSVEKLCRVSDEVIVVAKDMDQVSTLQKIVPQVHFASDRIPSFGPVAGLAAGIKCSSGSLVFVTGCDLPFLNARVIERLFELSEGYDAAVPVWPNGMEEPLHSVYNKERMSLACDSAMRRNERRISAPLRGLKINRVSVEMLRPLDLQLLTFFNINNPEDLAEARRLWSKDSALEPGRSCTL